MILRGLHDIFSFFSFQKAAVSSNFLLKAGLYVEEDIVFLVLAFCIGQNLGQLDFYGVQEFLNGGQLASITSPGLL